MRMKYQIKYLGGITLAVALSAALGYAQTTGRGSTPAQGRAGEQGPAATNRQAMMAEMQAQQKRLDDLVAQMNAAKGEDKVDRIAAVVNEMAAMHKRMSGMMMQGGMMQMPQRRVAPADQPRAPSDPDHSEHR
jgi:hypothetical protein